jgi:predicted transcriptional regulator
MIRKSPATKKVKATFSLRLAPNVRAALDKAAEAEDRSAGYIALRFIVEGLKAGGHLK